MASRWPIGVKCTALELYVCLSVCLSVFFYRCRDLWCHTSPRCCVAVNVSRVVVLVSANLESHIDHTSGHSACHAGQPLRDGFMNVTWPLSGICHGTVKCCFTEIVPWNVNTSLESTITLNIHWIRSPAKSQKSKIYTQNLQFWNFEKNFENLKVLIILKIWKEFCCILTYHDMLKQSLSSYWLII